MKIEGAEEGALQPRYGEENPAEGEGYDAILHGMGLGSLTVGALLAKRGKRVLILDSPQDSEDLPFHQAGDFLFDAYPPFWIGEGPQESHPVFRELGIALDLKPLNRGLQVVLPHHRLTFYPEEDLFRREVQREFPRKAEALVHFFQRMKTLREGMEAFLVREMSDPPQGMKAYWSQFKQMPFSLSSVLFREGKLPLSPFLRPLRGDPEIALLIDSLLAGWGGRGKKGDWSALFASFLFSQLCRPVYYPSEGMRGVHQALLAAFLDQGGEVRSNPSRPEMILSGRAIRGIIMDGGQRLLGKTLLGGYGLWEIYRMARKMRKTKGNRAHPPLQQALSLYLDVDEEVLPEEMGEWVLWIRHGDPSPEEAHPVWITASPSEDRGRAPVGRRALSIHMRLPPSDAEEMDQEGRAKGLLQELEDFLPFLSQHGRLLGIHWHRSFSMLEIVRGWGAKLGIAPLRQIGYPGLRPFSPHKQILFIGDLPLFGFGLRAKIDGGYYWANFLAQSMGGRRER